MLIQLAVPATNERGPIYMDQALAAIHQALTHGREALGLLAARLDDAVALGCDVPGALGRLVAGQLFAQYPDGRIDSLPEESLECPKGHVVRSFRLQLSPDLFPIKRFSQFEDALNRVAADPLTPVLNALAAGKDEAHRSLVRFDVRPAARRRSARARRTLEHLHHELLGRRTELAKRYVEWACGSWPRRFVARLFALVVRLGRVSEPVATATTRTHDREDHLQAAADKLGRQLFEATITLTVTAPQRMAAEAKAKLVELAAAFGHFQAPHLSRFHAVRCGRLFRHARRFLLSTEELATLWHPPVATVRAPALASVESRELEPPVELPTPDKNADLALLGLATFRGKQQPFGLLPDDRRRHLAILGKTGMGKSTLLLEMLTSDIRHGRGVGLVDPHGDLAEAVLAAIPRNRTNDIVHFDAGDAGHPVAFNPLTCRTPAERPLVASGIISAFKKMFGEFWGPRLEHILRNALLALLEVPGSSLLSIQRLLSDARFRQRITGQVADPVVRGYWQHEFAAMPPKLQQEAIAPVLNKIGAFVTSPLLRNILGQPKSSIDLRQILDEGKVLVCNLSKGRLGEDASALLGSLLVSSLQLAAMSRADQPEQDRRDFYLFVDEFQNFATDSFGTILSEARKYRLSLTIANQYLAQMDEPIRHAVFGNVGSLLCFQCGADDAEFLAMQMGTELTPEDLLRLPKHHAYVRLLIDGQPSRPFSVATLPQRKPPSAQHVAVVRRYSRQRYGRPAARVEREIALAVGVP